MILHCLNHTNYMYIYHRSVLQGAMHKIVSTCNLSVIYKDTQKYYITYTAYDE